nr:mesothelin-like protein [Loxodonta africana]
MRGVVAEEPQLLTHPSTPIRAPGPPGVKRLSQRQEVRNRTGSLREDPDYHSAGTSCLPPRTHTTPLTTQPPGPALSAYQLLCPGAQRYRLTTAWWAGISNVPPPADLKPQLVWDPLPVTPEPSCPGTASARMTITSHRAAMGPWAGVLASLGLILLVSLTAHCSSPQTKSFFQSQLYTDRASQWARANDSLLHSFWCQPASQLNRDQLSALVRRMTSQQVLLEAWQLSCLANLVGQHGLQDDFEQHPPDLLLFYDLTQVRGDNCQAFTHHASQGDTELLANLPDQRVALRCKALDCLGGPRPWLSASDLLLLGSMVCDMDVASIAAADPHILQNRQRCPRLTTAQQDVLNMLLASGRTVLGWAGAVGGTYLLRHPRSTLTQGSLPQGWDRVQPGFGLRR